MLIAPAPFAFVVEVRARSGRQRPAGPAIAVAPRQRVLAGDHPAVADREGAKSTSSHLGIRLAAADAERSAEVVELVGGTNLDLVHHRVPNSHRYTRGLCRPEEGKSRGAKSAFRARTDRLCWLLVRRAWLLTTVVRGQKFQTEWSITFGKMPYHQCHLSIHRAFLARRLAYR